MAEELAFARKASGLVRGLSIWDAFLVGFMNQGVMPNLWFVLTLGLSIYLGGNIIIAALISLVLAGFSFPLVWGILGGTMPRSGGEYIYNSRILHPVIGLIESWGNAWVWIFWIYILAPWVADPGLAMTADMAGWTGAAEFARSAGGVAVLATVTNIAAFCTIAFGIRIMAMVQKVVFVVGMAGVVAMLVVLSLFTKADFVARWNALAAEHDSLTYDEFVPAVSAAAGTTVPVTWNWVDTLGLLVACTYLFAYAYCITYVSGEVKRPDKSIIYGNLLAIVVPAVCLLWAGFALYRLVDFDFLSAASWLDYNYELDGYVLPFTPSVLGLAHVLVPSKVLAVLMGASYVVFCYWWCVLSYLAAPRVMFAWGMDRMGPKWFTSVNPRFASPIKNYIVCFIIAEGLILLSPFYGDAMQGYTVTGLEWLTVFGTTAVAALLLPYRGKVRSIWNASPYRGWTVAGVPLLSVGAVVNLFYIALLFWFFIVRPEMRSLTWFSLGMYGLIYAAGGVWYVVFRRRNAAAGISASITYGQLPPE